MSSVGFAARLRVSRTLRNIVLASGGFLAMSGVVILCNLPIDPEWRALLVVVWTALNAWELVRMRRTYMTFGHIEISSGGGIRLRRRSGVVVSAVILPGSVLLGRLGWLRMKTADGVRIAELMYGNPRKNKDWRRLQVIWRHL